LALISSGGFAEVQKYVNLTAHVDSWSYVVFGDAQFQKLPEELQQVVLAAAQDMQDYESKIHLEEESQIKAELESKGMVFVEVDRTAFSEAASDALYLSLSPEMQKVYNQIKALGD
jgi:TRAP-type C4-dicarboxylate transport system substrate-binding protein